MMMMMMMMTKNKKRQKHIRDCKAVAKEIDAKVADATTSLDAFQQQMCPVEDLLERICFNEGLLYFFFICFLFVC